MRNLTLIEILIGTAVILLLGVLVVSGVNSIGIETQQYSANVGDKHYKAGHYTTSSTVTNGVASTTQTYHPPEYRVYVSIEGERVKCSTTEGKYSMVSIGAKANIKAGSGRIFKSLVCKGIQI